MAESRLGSIAYACSAPVLDGLLCAFGQWYLAAGYDEAPVYAAGAGMIGFGVSFGRDFDRILNSFYS